MYQQQTFGYPNMNTDGLSNELSSLDIKRFQEHSEQFNPNINFPPHPNQQSLDTVYDPQQKPNFINQANASPPSFDPNSQFHPNGVHNNKLLNPPQNFSSANYSQNNHFQQGPNHSMTQPSIPSPPMPPMPTTDQRSNLLQQPQISRQQPLLPPMPLQNSQPMQDSFGAPQMISSPNGRYPTNAGYPTQPPLGYANNALPRQPQFSQNVNVDNLPSAVEVMESNRTQFTGPYYTGQRGVVPPFVTTNCPTRDQGICGSRFVRSSHYAVPCTSDLLKTVGVPFSLTISPFAEQHPEDMEILISDMGAQGPVRCSRCKAYMNPFMNFIDGGRRFQCALCNGLTEVNADYFSHLDHTGRRIDIGQRPELCFGSYELLATAEYCKNSQLPLAPALIFLLDVSMSSIRSGMVQLFCSQFINRILLNLPKWLGRFESAY